MPDGVHIPCLAAHQVAGALSVVEVEILVQKLAVYLAPHVVEKSLGSGLEDQLVKEAQNAGEQRHSQQAGNQLRQRAVIAGQDHIVHDDPRQVGIHDGQRRNKRGQEEPQEYQCPILFQETAEPFDRCHMYSSPGMFLHSIRPILVCGLMVHCTFPGTK